MNWESISAKFERVRTGETDLQKKIRGLRRRLTLLLAVVGPGLITSNVDNDAGGISVYTQAGAQYGYALLWSLIPMTIALYVTEEMCARMGVVTGKGLSDLIREEFGFRPTFFVMVTGFLWTWPTWWRNLPVLRQRCRFLVSASTLQCRLRRCSFGCW